MSLSQGALLSCCFEAVDIGSKSFIIFLLYLHKAWCVSMNICITELQPKDALDFIPSLHALLSVRPFKQDFSAWRASQIIVHVRPHDLALARHVQHLLKCQQQFLCPWTSPLALRSPVHWMWEYPATGSWWSFLSLCGAQGVYVCLHSFVHRFLIRLGSWLWLEHHSEVLQFICKLLQLCYMCRQVGGRFQACKLVLKLSELLQ